MAKRPVEKYDFMALGKAIKDARKVRKESRKKVSDEMFISPRYLANIENKGQHPSLQIFFEFVRRYHIKRERNSAEPLCFLFVTLFLIPYHIILILYTTAFFLLPSCGRVTLD